MSERLDNWEGTAFVTDPLWGDNGKGKVVDLMAQRADLVVKTNGGPNAGHTVKNEYGEFGFHLIPSGIFNPNALCVISDTIVVNPLVIADEIKALTKAGVEISSENLLISKNAHLIMPWHITRDNMRELSRGGRKIGTTGRGIGEVYADRSLRTGLVVGDLVSADFEKMFEEEVVRQEILTSALSPDGKIGYYNPKEILDSLFAAREVIGQMITEVLPVIWQYHDEGKNILGEAGQGMLLDLDRGGYPYVTSSHPGIAGFNLATGIPPKEVDRVIAVTKAYTTRVGEGPLPTELKDEVGERIREYGHEFGTTTGRPRRCGWLDIPAIKYGLRTGGVDNLALTKLDIFDSFPQIKICVGYRVGNKEYKTSPVADVEFMGSVEPIYETLPGWDGDTTQVKNFDELPQNAKKFVLRVEELAGVPIKLVSVGPEREASIYR